MIARRIRDGVPLGRTRFNAFEAVASAAHPSYEPLRSAFAEAGARAMLSGAGPAMFALVADETKAAGLAQRMIDAGYDARTVRLLPAWGIDGMSAV